MLGPSVEEKLGRRCYVGFSVLCAVVSMGGFLLFDQGKGHIVLGIHHNRALVAHMGDSRAYLFRAGRLKRLTRDHSLIQRLIESGDIKPEEVATHARKRNF